MLKVLFIWVSPPFLGTTLRSIYAATLGPVLDPSPGHLEAGYDFTPSSIVSETGEMRTLVAYELEGGLVCVGSAHVPAWCPQAPGDPCVLNNKEKGSWLAFLLKLSQVVLETCDQRSPN